VEYLNFNTLNCMCVFCIDDLFHVVTQGFIDCMEMYVYRPIYIILVTKVTAEVSEIYN
jgi:hypothetical protein